MNLLIPLLAQSQKAEQITPEFNALKNNENVFESFLKKQTHYEVDRSTPKILLGKWKETTQLRATPTVLINGYILPTNYKINGMKNIILILFFLVQSSLYLFADKTVQIQFPDNEEKKLITVRYSLLDLNNYFYKPYIYDYQTTGNQIDITVPDSILFFNMSISRSTSDYQWSRHVDILIPQGDTLGILLDNKQKPRFFGKYAEKHQYLYRLQAAGGYESADTTINRFVADASTNSFFTFIQNAINKEINEIDHLKLNNEQYEFIKNLMIDSYLYRASMSLERTETMEKIRSKTDSVQFCHDIGLLYANYAIRFNSGISNDEKARLRYAKIIPGVRLDLGYDYRFFPQSAFLDKDEQSVSIAENIIANASIGMYDEKTLSDLHRLYKQVFPDSPYIVFMERIDGLKEENQTFTFAHYSIKTGWEEYGSFSDLSQALKTYISKPVLLDFWATWCSPCIREFRYNGELNPFLKDNNIEKIYVSVDYPGAYETWKKTIQRLELEGFHYFATANTKCSYILPGEGIPKFVLLDSDGKVLINNCERPGSGKLIPQIKEKFGL